jgi:hypothetical protein
MPATLLEISTDVDARLRDRGKEWVMAMEQRCGSVTDMRCCEGCDEGCIAEAGRRGARTELQLSVLRIR